MAEMEMAAHKYNNNDEEYTEDEDSDSCDTSDEYVPENEEDDSDDCISEVSFLSQENRTHIHDKV